MVCAGVIVEGCIVGSGARSLNEFEGAFFVE